MKSFLFTLFLGIGAFIHAAEGGAGGASVRKDECYFNITRYEKCRDLPEDNHMNRQAKAALLRICFACPEEPCARVVVGRRGHVVSGDLERKYSSDAAGMITIFYRTGVKDPATLSAHLEELKRLAETAYARSKAEEKK